MLMLFYCLFICLFVLFSFSSLSIVFRYKCGQTTGPDCFTDCADHSENETCPETSPAPGITFVTFPGFNKSCENDCNKTDIVSTVQTTEYTTELTNETTVTDVFYETTTEETNTTDAEVDTTEHMTKTSETTITKPPSTSIKIQTSTSYRTVPPEVSVDTTEDRTPPYSFQTTPTTPYIDNTPYWPAIVGGVLGAVALFAAAGFICYFNRQK